MDDDDSTGDTPAPHSETTQLDLSGGDDPNATDTDSVDSTSTEETEESDVTDTTSTSQSIEDMLLEFDEKEGLIRDRSLLDPNHVVSEDRIVGRDEQLQEVTKMLRVALGDNRPPNLFLYGPSGTGKSLITKAVCKNISQICENRGIELERLRSTAKISIRSALPCMNSPNKQPMKPM
jgi:ORC complex protein Cdc6/Orc1